ncbi:peptidase S28 [Martensiomyces pterosporus]|nr:peptidase S28 [Martensiomyces pterosporus]
MRLAVSLPFLALVAVASGQKNNTSSSIPASSTPFWFPQPVDHFGLNSSTWNQQYVYNATFYKPGGPIYILSPGESSLSNRYTDNSHFNSLAQRTNGLVVAVEHRFYGKSNPMPDLSGASLKYHTLENVLEDYASFARAAKSAPSKVFAVPVRTGAKIIFAGGSYSGSLAALMRTKYPRLVDGAWASSAVVYGRLQNYQFDQSFGRHLTVLGCGSRFSQAVKDLDIILLSGNETAISEVQTRFGAPPLTPRDFAGLVSGLIVDYATAPISTTSDPVNVTVCSYFDGTRSDLDSYALAFTEITKRMGYTQSALAQVGDTSLNLDNYALGQSSRTWYYQSCTWYGNWQVAPPQHTGFTSYRSQLDDLTYFQTNCRKKFGSDIKVPVDVEDYNRKWFSTLRGASNVYYTTGSLDIWRDSTPATTHGYILPNTPRTPIYVIEGATHVQDLSGDKPTDLDSVRQARALGDSLVLRWIS